MANTTELKVFAGTSIQAVMNELLPQFERTNGCRVSIGYGPGALVLDRIVKGETADLIIINSNTIDELAKMGKIVAASRCDLAHNGIGMAVLAGAPKPDIGSVEAFKRTLLAAKSIAYTEVGASGIYFARLIERLGIAKEVRAKAKTRPGGLIGELVASGEAEIAIQQVPELVAVSGIELVGPLPQELQVISTVTASLFAGTPKPEAAQKLIDFLRTPAAVSVFQAKGFEV